MLKMLADTGKSAHKAVARLQVRSLRSLWTFLVAGTEGSEVATVTSQWWEHGGAEVSP